MKLETVEALIAHHEGFRGQVYLCPSGFKTIGYGHNLEANPLSEEECQGLGGLGLLEVNDENFPISLNEPQAAWLLKRDINRYSTELLAKHPWVMELSPVRQAVLVDMAFNMGTAGLFKFKRTLGAAQAGNWELVATGMKASKWYTQVGARSQRLVTMMLTDEWPEV